MHTQIVRAAGRKFRILDLGKAFGPDLERLPYVLRILLENNLRNAGEGDAMAGLFRDWLRTGRSEAEIPFAPSRVLMHDTTCVPALVDIAAMRDAIAESGGDPTSLSPVIPVDVSVDHSIAVDRFAAADAFPFNMAKEVQRNAERYRLMKWATKALSGFRVHPPGTGIMHTINLEQLASVIAVVRRDGEEWAVPDTLLGTDSHTPMINGIGVLAWGVGGLEAESAIFGMPVTLRLPDVLGVYLSGRLPAGTLSTDLALAVTSRLRSYGVSGQFVEFFGPGVSTLTAGDRAVVANMAPEYGASTGYFPIDENTVRYLAATGRPKELTDRVEAIAKAMMLWFDPAARPRYTDILQLELSQIHTTLAGPRRPQDLVRPGDVPRVLKQLAGKAPPYLAAPGIPEGAVAIAAVTSCTNTSDPSLLVAAGLVARKARKLGMKPPCWVKTSLAPGSPAAQRYLARSGLLEDFEAVGFGIVGFGCTTCIGNSGPLPPEMEAAITSGLNAVAVLSGNRNFPGRIHPHLQNGFLASPPMVVAYALAGDVMRDITCDPVGQGDGGRQIYLSDLWPDRSEVDAVLAANADSTDYGKAFHDASQNAAWANLVAPDAPQFPWDVSSTYIRRPPFASANQPNRLGAYEAYPLLVLGDDMTTDHVSPAGQIAQDSIAGKHLTARSVSADDLNVLAARRGNWEVMVRGLFDNRDALNYLAPQAPPGYTIHIPSGEIAPLWDVACRYRDAQVSTIIIAGERYGTGSSRDWAAKGVALMGVRAVLALSFERIHRTNLVGMGILPIILPKEATAGRFTYEPGNRIFIDATAVRPRSEIHIRDRTQRRKRAFFPRFDRDRNRARVDDDGSRGVDPLILSRAVAGTGRSRR